MFRKPLFILFAVWAFLMIFEGVSAQSTQPPRLLAEVKVSETISDIDWNDINQLLAVGTHDGVYIYTGDLQAVTHFLASSHVMDVAWKPDGTQLATVSLSGINTVIWDYDSTTHQVTQTEILTTNVDNYRGAISTAWNVDGTRLAAMQIYNEEGTYDLLGVVEIFDTETWAITLTLQRDEVIFPAPMLSWNPAMDSIVFGEYYCSNNDCIRPQLRPRFYVSDTITGQTQFSDTDLEDILDLQWSPDGTRLAVAGSNRLKIYDASTGQMIPEWNPPHNLSIALAWGSSGQRLLDILDLNKVQIYSVNPETLLYEFDTVQYPEIVASAYWLDQDQKLFLGTYSGDLSVWNTDFECADC